MQLTRQGRIAQRHERLDSGAAHPVNVELRPLQGAQQGLLGALKEVQPLDRAFALTLGFGQACQVTLARGGVPKAGRDSG